MNIIKRGTPITQNLIREMFIETYHNINQVRFENLILSTKQFNNLEGAYNDAVSEANIDLFQNYVEQLQQIVNRLGGW